MLITIFFPFAFKVCNILPVISVNCIHAFPHCSPFIITVTKSFAGFGFTSILNLSLLLVLIIPAVLVARLLITLIVKSWKPPYKYVPQLPKPLTAQGDEA